MDLVDDDGSSMIEFGEFLSIIKGGSNAVSLNFYKLSLNRKRVMMKVVQVQFISSLRN